MSRLGKKPIKIDPGVSVSVENRHVKVVGPRGQLEVSFHSGLKILVTADQLEVTTNNGNISHLQGLTRSLIQNAIIGVARGWAKTLELVGVGFRAETSGNELILHLGFSHPVKIVAPDGIRFEIKDNKIIVSGADKYLVGELAAKIRRIKKPEPYKGKGIRYEGEIVRKKAGKAAKAAGATVGK